MLHTDVLQEGIQSPIYDASEGFDISSTMNQLLHILRGVSCYRYTAPLIYYQDHLRKLETLRPRLPADPRLPTVQHESHQAPIAVILNVPEEQQFALVSSPSCNIPLTYLDSKLYLHTMHMGTTIALTWPLLLQVVAASIIKQQDLPDSEKREKEELAYTW